MFTDPNGTFFREIGNWFKKTANALIKWTSNLGVEVKNKFAMICNSFCNFGGNSINLKSAVSMDGDFGFGFGFEIGTGTQTIFDKFSNGLQKFCDDIGKFIHKSAYFIWDDVLKPLSDSVFVDGALSIGGVGSLVLSKIPQFAAYSVYLEAVGGWLTIIGALLWFRSLFD